MLEALRRLVAAESFSTDPAGLERCAAVVEELCVEILGRPPERAGRHLVWRRAGPRPVLLLCHYDTVWPPGTLPGFPFEVEDGIARGPGAFDMKAGIVQGLFAVRETDGPISILLTADEEIGSPTSKPLIETEARTARAALVLEPATGHAVKVARKGVGTWRITAKGRAAHAGLAPGEGVNAVVEIARLAETLGRLARPEAETQVTVTMIGGGQATNVVPEEAWLTVDVRAWTAEEAELVAAALEALEPHDDEIRLEVAGGMNRGPLERSASDALYRRLHGLGYDVDAAEVGGASDGNLTAALGVPTLDGLGAVGGGAHARDEHVIIGEMPVRAEMVATLIRSLHADG